MRWTDYGVRHEALSYGADAIVLRIEWAAAPAHRGYNGRIWRMRPLREWKVRQAMSVEPSAKAGLG